MSEMIERVARAIRPEAFEPITEGARTAGMTEFLEKCRERGVEQALKRARAAIEAMREPTEAMVASGESAASFGIGKPKDDDAIPRVWRWMIDAALSNSKGGEG